MAAHDLHKKQAIVRIGGIPDLVDRFDGRIDGRIKANGVIGAV
jgi:hypothetical protein